MLEFYTSRWLQSGVNRGETSMDRQLRRVVIKEELIHLTGNVFKAVILNQFIYWSQRMSDVDRYIEEESRRMESDGEALKVKPTNGWIYKSADDLLDETMLGISRQSVNRCLNTLIEHGYLLWRHNPEHRWDRTKQYRVDFVRVRRDLADLGYTLDGYPLLNLSHAMRAESDAMLNLSNGTLCVSDGLPIESDRVPTMSDGMPSVSDRMFEFEPAISKITSEITIASDDEDANDTNRDLNILHRVDNLDRMSRNSAQGKQGISDSQTASVPCYGSLQQPEDIPDSARDPYQAVEWHMRRYVPKYTTSKGDTRSVQALLNQGIPLDYVLAGIEYTFAQYPDKYIHSFSYIAKVILDRWSVEMDRKSLSERSTSLSKKRRPSREPSSTVQTKHKMAERDERYKNFYDLFPDA